MTDAERDALLDDLEAGLREDVTAALALTAKDFADAVDSATELTAAAFSVSRIGDMWRRRVSGIMTSLRRIAGRGAAATADDLGDIPPAPADLDAGLEFYLSENRQLLNGVGERLSAQARASLSEGVNNGESLDELKARITAVFAESGTQLGESRANRIAATEATRAFNAGVLAAAEALTGEERPLVKQWVTRHDEKVRQAHRDADGQLQLLADPFNVGGAEMLYPGDPTAPADLTVNCRCSLKVQAATPAADAVASAEFEATVEELRSKMPAKLKRYWLAGPGAAKIGWGTPGSFKRCVRELHKYFPEDTEGLCANLYHEATGQWPGRKKSASSEAHTGAMVALMPASDDADFMALADGEEASQLHVTLAYLGDAADWDTDAMAVAHGVAARLAAIHDPVAGRAFGVAQWNPDSDEPCWVWNIGNNDQEAGSTLDGLHGDLMSEFERLGQPLPVQYTPWSPHIAGVYSGDNQHERMVTRTGPITFDRIRVAFAGEYTDYPFSEFETTSGTDGTDDAMADEMPQVLTWSTPDDTALAFENQQTGDGRVFAPGALYWDETMPLPLQYAEEMLSGHEGAQLAGAILGVGRDGDRIAGHGVLYTGLDAGEEAAMLLAQGAPLGVSVDLDDVDIEMVSTNPDAAVPVEGDVPEPYRVRLMTASLLPHADGGFTLTGMTAAEMAAGGSGMMIESSSVTFTVSADGLIPGDLFEIQTDLGAAAGDPDNSGGIVIDKQSCGEYLMRITRGRLRGATLVTIPAYANARIVLDDPSALSAYVMPGDVSAAGWSGKTTSTATSDYDKVLRHVRSSKVPVGAARVGQFLKIPVMAVQRILSKAASRGEVVRLTRGLYTDKTTSAKADHVMMDDHVASLTASATGAVDLPVAPRDTAWDGQAALDRVFTWADGDTDKIAKAFAYREDGADPALKGSYKLGYADVIGGELTIVPKGVSAAIGALNGARGGTDIPEDQVAAVRSRLEEVSAHVSEETGGEAMSSVVASAWTAMRDLPPMPASWFAEPTEAELPAGGPGVNYANGRIFGWVAQAGEQHAGFARKVTIDSIGRIDTSHFLRQRFTLDDGSVVKAGAYTMNAGHHRDGAECETASCQFDDSRTVAGIVTVGMNSRGMWFSGAAAPWLSEWDRQVFMATQPSYHMKKSGNGGWQLRAVLSVPVPGHSSPLLASAVVERSQMALTAAATMAEVDSAIKAETERQAVVQPLVDGIDYDRLADSIVAASARAEQRKADEEAELAALLAEAAELSASAATMGDETTEDEGA